MNQLLCCLLLLSMAFSINSAKAQEWLTNLDEAKSKSATESKPILLVFQGSDWCAPCMKLEKDVWHTKIFKEYAAEHLVLLQADFPRRKKNALSKERQEHNANLADRYNQGGIFPLVVLLDPDGKVIGQTGYKKTSVENYIGHLEQLLKS